jgi:hypothetical protein
VHRLHPQQWCSGRSSCSSSSGSLAAAAAVAAGPVQLDFTVGGLKPIFEGHSFHPAGAPYKYCMAGSHTNLKIGQVNRQIYKFPHLYDAQKWSHSSS